MTGFVVTLVIAVICAASGWVCGRAHERPSQDRGGFEVRLTSDDIGAVAAAARAFMTATTPDGYEPGPPLDRVRQAAEGTSRAEHEHRSFLDWLRRGGVS